MRLNSCAADRVKRELGEPSHELRLDEQIIVKIIIRQIQGDWNIISVWLIITLEIEGHTLSSALLAA